MARKRRSDEDILRLVQEIEVHVSDGLDVASACRKAGVSTPTYYSWRKKFGGMGRSQLSEMKALQKENDRLKKILAELELDKLILKESLDFLKPQRPDDGSAASGRHSHTSKACNITATHMSCCRYRTINPAVPR